MNIVNRIIAVRNDVTVYGNAQRVHKVFKGNHKKSEVMREAYIHSVIENTGLSVPKVTSVFISEGNPVIEYERIKGETIEQLLLKEPAHKENLLTLFTEAQLEIHRKCVPELERIASSEPDTLPMLPLCHGDFRPSNVMIAHNDVIYVIDWSNANNDGILTDVARTWFNLYLDFNVEYAEYYLSTYCRSGGIEIEKVRDLMPEVGSLLYKEAPDFQKPVLSVWQENLCAYYKKEE